MSEEKKFLNIFGENIKANAVFIILFGVAIVLIALTTINLLNLQNSNSTMVMEHDEADTVEPVGTIKLSEDLSREEVYNLVSCPCCGKPIANKCCGMATQRMTYIDGLVDAGKPRTEVLLLVGKKYGMNSILDKSIRQEIRDGLIESAPEDRPIISIKPVNSDLGNVSVAKGEVSTTMIVTNEGKSDLIIDKLESSCGCTSATLIMNGVESPRFSMPGHGKQPENLSATIAPGEEAELKVYYNPTVHPTFRGAVTRTVSIFSSDPVDFEVNVKIEANQVN